MRERYTAVCIGGPKDGEVVTRDASAFMVRHRSDEFPEHATQHKYEIVEYQPPALHGPCEFVGAVIRNFWIHDSLDPDAPSTCERVRKAWLRGTPEGRTC